MVSIAVRRFCNALLLMVVYFGAPLARAGDVCLCEREPSWGQLVLVPGECPELGMAKIAAIIQRLQMPTCSIVEHPVFVWRPDANPNVEFDNGQKEFDYTALTIAKKLADGSWQLVFEENRARAYREERERQGLPALVAPPREIREPWHFQLAASAAEAVQTEYRIDLIRHTGEVMYQIPLRFELEPCAPGGRKRSGQDIDRRVTEIVTLHCTQFEDRSAEVRFVQSAPLAERSIRVAGTVTFFDAEGREMWRGYLNGDLSGENTPGYNFPASYMSVSGMGMPRDRIAERATKIVLRSTCRDMAVSTHPHERDWWCGEVVIDMLR